MHASIGGMKIAMSAHPFSPVAARWPVLLVLIATLCCACAVWGFRISLRGVVPASASIDWLGAKGVPHAAAFNAFAFVVPGVLVAAVAISVYLDAGSSRMRIGALIALFSALAFAGQGLLPLDLSRLDASSRLHASCWSAWWLTTATGALLLAAGAQRRPRTARRRIASVASALLVPFFALFAPALFGAATAQTIAYALWFAWWLLVARDISGNAASAPGSSPPARR